MTAYEKELMDRVIRLESRVVQLGDHVGANLRTKQRIEISTPDMNAIIHIDSLDVSLSRIYHEMSQYHERTGQGCGGAIPVYWKDKLVITVYV